MRTLFTLALALTLTLVSGVPVVRARTIPAVREVVEKDAEPDEYHPGPYRTTVLMRHAHDLQRVRDLGASVLEVNDAEAVLLVTADQLADLARLGFRPHRTDSVTRLEAIETGPGGPRLRLNAVSAEETILTAESSDSDGDGLTDTEETWWCTDPGDPDSDSDLVSDGDEVSALVDWIQDPRTGRPASGKPFIGWPPNHVGCYDDDNDSVPDLAETNMLGLNINRESTDRDKFDDGQELFGNTHCPGGAGSCSYGYLPRDVDGGIVPPEMPNWVRAPGNHPMVAAFPEPVIQVVEDSLRLDRVATITTERGEMTQETHTYESSVTKGTSTSVSDTETWNQWQEIATTDQDAVHAAGLDRTFLSSSGLPIVQGFLPKWAAKTNAVVGVAAAAAGLICVAATLGACAIPLAATVAGVGLASAGLAAADTFWPDKVQEEASTNSVNTEDINGPVEIDDPQSQADSQRATSESQDLSTGGGGNRYSVDDGSQINVEKVVEVSAPTKPPEPSATYHHGTAHGGAHSVSTTEYEEHTITEGEAFTSGQDWSTAWSTDTVHAADLRFSYQVCNEGVDYAREITGLLFNIYLGDDPNPIHTYNASAQIGTLSNVMPDECHTYTSDPVALTLDEMRAIDTGTNLYVVVEDYAFGNDELFYQDAVNGGMIIGIEDGYDDGDELVDNYVIPTWGSETVQSVLQRYFPTIEDESGNLVAIYTPEFTAPPTFSERGLVKNNWWNVYLSSGLEHTNAFSQTMAAPSTGVVIRMGYDRDYDGFSDRTEVRLGTDPTSAASYPHPELTAGYTVERYGDTVTALMSFLNEGNYDAYGVEAVMFSPDDTVTIGNNTIGGGGRVNAGQRIDLGPRVMDPGLANWTTSTAIPFATGHYGGSQDKVYSFVADDSGSVGSGSLELSWNDGYGNSGALDVGGGYHPPLPMDVAEGLQVGFETGTVTAGESFTVEVRLPGDTMTYTINNEPHTEPEIVVSYNDPQGNHRFITPVEMEGLHDDLSGRSDDMLHDVGIGISTLEPVSATGTNTTYFVVNHPYSETLEDAHVHVSVANITGTVVARWSLTQTLPPGPAVVLDTWETSVFTEPYKADEDYLMLAFWTDHQWNIIDSTGRMLSSFDRDPLPRVGATPQVWDFGIVTEGDAVYREFVAANTGDWPLSYWADTRGISSTLSGTRSGRLPATVSQELGLLLDTSEPGPVSGTLSVRSADVHTPVLTVPITGYVEPLADLRVSDADVTFSEPKPVSGTIVTATVTVHNHSASAARDVPVRFCMGEPAAGAAQIDSDREIELIPPGGSASASVSWAYEEGWNHVHVSVDPEGIIPETDTRDNNARAFLNVGETLPLDGVLDKGHVVLIDDPADLVTNTVVITDGAVLVMDGVAASLDSLLLGRDGSLILDATQLEVNQFDSSQVGPGALTALLAGSMLGSPAPIEIAASQIVVISSTLRSQGLTGDSGEDGQPGRLVLSGTSVCIRGSAVKSIAGAGGDGFPAGHGGDAQVTISATMTIDVDEVDLDAIAGMGGHGQLDENESHASPGGDGGLAEVRFRGPSVGVYNSTLSTSGGLGGMCSTAFWNGSAGGAGGTANLSVDGNEVDLISSTMVAVGGQGHPGCGAGTSSSASAGHGGDGGHSSVTVKASELQALPLSVSAEGGSGGQGGRAWVYRGGNGGVGGSAAISLPVDSLLLGDALVSVAGGAGGDGGRNSSYHPAHGGDGGDAELLAAPQLCKAAAFSITLSGGNGGHGPNTVGTGWQYVGGDGGDGGAASFQWQVSDDWSLSSQAFTVRRGIGGDPGTGDGGTGTPGDDGAHRVAIADGHGDSLKSGSTVFAQQVMPHLLALHDTVTATLTWDGSYTSTVTSPFTVCVPQSPHQYWLDVAYDYGAERSATSTHQIYVRGTSADFDGDGFTDAEEAGIFDTDPALMDTDEDGLDDGDEVAARTDPLNPDSDYDGIPDGEDPDALLWPELELGPGALAFSDPYPTEGDAVALMADVANSGSHDAKGVVVAFFDGDPEGDGRYLCADFLHEAVTTTNGLATCQWDTSGITGTREVHVVVDPLDRIPETNQDDNVAHAPLTVLSKPDLRVASLAPAETDVVEGQALSVTVVVSNTGEAAVGGATLTLYDGSVATGTVAHTASVSVAGQAAVTVSLRWTAGSVGAHSLAAVIDSDGLVPESVETNNDAQTSVYVGWGDPVYVDAGGDPDPRYSSGLGYGLVSPNTSVVDSCGADPERTYRQGVYGEPLVYRFDHLLPSHYYHLDTTMSVCGGQRLQDLWVDGVRVAGPLTVTASSVTEHSQLIASDTYTDHSILVGVTASGLAAPAAAELTLTDIYYCYRDCGSDDDPAYAPDLLCGYHDAQSQGADMWGSAPTQTVRFDPNDSDVVYRASGLDPDKRYTVNLTLYEGDGTGREETVRIDGVAVGPTVTLTSEPQYLVIDVPPEAYQSDGTIDVAVVETSGWDAPVVSEFAVEETTLGLGPTPAAEFIASPITGTAPLTVTFTDHSTGDISGWEWAFGDGGTSTEPGPTHVYDNPGVYSPTLTVTGPGGEDSLTRSGYITAYHRADLTKDCLVDVADIQPVAHAWRCSTGDGCYASDYDLDGDGTISVIDIMQVAAAWGWSCSGVDATEAATLGRQALSDSEQTAATNTPLVSLQPISRTVDPGETFTVSTVISNAAELGAFQYVLRYNPRVLRADGAILGPYLGSTGRIANSLGPTIDETAGTLTFGGFSFGTGTGPVGGGVLSTVTLTARDVGSTAVDLDGLQILYPNGASQAASGEGGQVHIAGTRYLYLPVVVRD